MKALSSRAWLAPLLSLALATSQATARELWQSGEASLDLSGSVRQIGVLTKGTGVDAFQTAIFANPVMCLPADNLPDCPAFDEVGRILVGSAFTRLRLRVDGRANAHFSAAIEIDNELVIGTLDTFEASLGDGLATSTFVDASGSVGNDRVEYRYSLYRGYLYFESERLEVVLGRQRIPWGVGRLWNPIDRFNAIQPLAIEADRSAGVDAIDARIMLSGFTWIEAVFAPRRVREDHSYAVRLHGVLADVDYSVVGGVFEEATTAGMDLSTNLGDAAGRMELVWTSPSRKVWPIDAAEPERLPDFWQLVVSVDYNFSLGNGLYTLVEYLYNGNGLGFGRGKAGGLLPFFERRPGMEPLPNIDLWEPATADLFGGSRVVTRSKHLTGFQIGYDFTPEIRFNFLTIADWDGLSATFFPTIGWSPLAWLELTLGVQAAAGPRLSEFGESPVLGYILADVFF